MFTKRAKIGYSPQMASIPLITSKDRHDQSENWATINKCKVDIVIKPSIFKINNSPRVASTQQVKIPLNQQIGSSRSEWKLGYNLQRRKQPDHWFLAAPTQMLAGRMKTDYRPQMASTRARFCWSTDRIVNIRAKLGNYRYSSSWYCDQTVDTRQFPTSGENWAAVNYCTVNKQSNSKFEAIFHKKTRKNPQMVLINKWNSAHLKFRTIPIKKKLEKKGNVYKHSIVTNFNTSSCWNQLKRIEFISEFVIKKSKFNNLWHLLGDRSLCCQGRDRPLPRVCKPYSVIRKIPWLELLIVKRNKHPSEGLM